MFIQQIKTFIDIQATPETIWEALIDFEAYNDWNPMLQNMQGQVQLGTPLTFDVLIGENKRLKLTAKVIEVDTFRALSWSGGWPIAFNGARYFRLEKIDEQHTRLHHGEDFKGVFHPLLARTIKGNKGLYIAMNDALKARVELTAA